MVMLEIMDLSVTSLDIIIFIIIIIIIIIIISLSKEFNLVKMVSSRSSNKQSIP